MNQSDFAPQATVASLGSDLGLGINDPTLVQHAQAGDDQAINCLLSRHWPAFRRSAERACGDPTEAEDVCQEACLKAIHSLGRFVAGRSFRAWVSSFIGNEAKNSARNLKKAGTRTQGIDIDIIETVSARADNKSEADMTTLLAMLSGQVPELRESRRQSAIFMIEYYAREHELPTIRMIARATHSSQGAAQRNHGAILAFWRHILAASELEVPSHRRAL